MLLAKLGLFFKKVILIISFIAKKNLNISKYINITNKNSKKCSTIVSIITKLQKVNLKLCQ